MQNKDISNKLTLHDSSKVYVDRIRSLWQLSEAAMRGQTFQTKNDLRLIILLQITATASRIIGCLLAQIDNNCFYNTELLLRPLVESLINYKYIKEDGTQMRARAFVLDEVNIRIKAAKNIIEAFDSGVVTRELEKKFNIDDYRALLERLEAQRESYKLKYGKENINFYDLKKRAKESGTLGAYATAYWSCSQEAHLSSVGLDRFMEETDGHLAAHWNLNLDRFNTSLRSFYILFLTLLSECSDSFNIPTKESLQDFPQI